LGRASNSLRTPLRLHTGMSTAVTMAHHSAHRGPQTSASQKRPHAPQPPRLKRSGEPLTSQPTAVRSKTASAGNTRSCNTLEFPAPLRDVNAYEKKRQVGKGTYGIVYLGADKITGDSVALKRINTEQEENGFPITAIREVKILKALNHPNVVILKEIVTSKDSGKVPKNVFMVFEYLEYDLTGILETREIRLSQDHIKSWTYQLLSGVHYMHKNKILHRDLKSSNLLVNRKGELKIADWGLARSWNKDMKHLTKTVVTLWYRPPELLLGNAQYTPKIDMWSVGCIIAEMFRRTGFLKGKNEAEQLELIFQTAGHPTPDGWPDIDSTCPEWKNCKQKPDELLPRKIAEKLKAPPVANPGWMSDNAIELIDKLLILNPTDRMDAYTALDVDYFFEDPMLKKAAKLNMKFSVPSMHEWEARQEQEKRMEARRAQEASMRNGGGNRPRPPPR